MKYLSFPHHAEQLVRDKPFSVYWSDSAERALRARSSPPFVEMELVFACMVRMLVHFHDQIENSQWVQIDEKLNVFYRPVIGKSCDIGDGKRAVVINELTEGPMANRFPKSLGIDFVDGEWVGKYV